MSCYPISTFGEDGDGFAVVRAMRKAYPNCVSILLTGYPAFESAVQDIEDEVDGYFVKPADIDPLVSTIERKLRTRQERGHRNDFVPWRTEAYASSHLKKR